MKKSICACALALLCLVLSTSAIPGQNLAPHEPLRNDRFQATRDLIREQMTKHDLPSLTISVAQHRQIIWEEGFGWADQEKLIRATPETMYGTASITKPLTAAALIRLVEARCLKLDDPLNEYLGDANPVAWSGDPRQATVRRIANHTAGLPQHWQFFYSNGKAPVPSTEDTLLHFGIIASPPGERYEYSNLDYAVLGEVVERVSSQPYGEYMRSHVFAPLGMTHTSIEPGEELKSFIAAKYDHSGARLPEFKTDDPGAAGAYSSAHDLIRFAMFHLKDHLSDQRQILTDSDIDQMQISTAPDLSGKSYGIGWHLDTVRHTLEHGGYYPGAAAIIRLVPAADTAVVVLTNISNDDQRTAENLIADATLGVLIPDWKQPPVQTSKPISTEPFVAPAVLVGRWVGYVHTYTSDLPLTLEFLPTGEFARARLGTQPNTSLSNIRYNAAEGRLTGEMHGVLDIPDAKRSQPYILRFDLKTDAITMTGTTRTYYFQDPMDPCLAQWVSLTKQR